MPSSYTTSLRFEQQFTGENLNLWGEKLNAAIARADDAVAGWLTKPLTGDYVLSTANGAADEARRAMLKFTGTGAFTVTVPAVSKRYDVWNACSGDLTLTNGSASVVAKAGEVVSVVTDGGAGFRRVMLTDFAGSALTSVTRVTGLSAPSANSDAANKLYVDSAVAAAAYSVGAFGVSIIPADSGKFLTNNGSTPSWGAVVPQTRTLSAGGLVQGGGDLTADRMFLVAAAGPGDVRGGSDTGKALTPAALMQSSAFQTLTDAATITWDCANGYNARVTLTASGHTIGGPAGLHDGLCVSLEIIQDTTGSRTVNWSSVWDFGAAGLPTLQTSPNKADRVFGQYNSRTGRLECSFRKGA